MFSSVPLESVVYLQLGCAKLRSQFALFHADCDQLLLGLIRNLIALIVRRVGRKRQREAEKADTPKPARADRMPASSSSETPKKMSFKERRELEQLPARIEALEAEIGELHQTMANPAFYKRDRDSIAATKALLEEREQELARTYERWESLEDAAP